ncbi:malto-oligosyltrehalose synthase [Bradyrhizobium sp. SZCCHNRI3052]|uniref:malto-oligosyltrehalose synthase n=1 Tax=Bradyrhizobium sp. SZCCHNRI3052 TaxID=3057295 RepID=UPI002916FD92|nr:malto-oligosyltrehalose synthase [Bradyrhizobium sp. SZCCHNRI3052]
MPPAIPLATYRLQLAGDFDFESAARVVPYLKALGISHVYASPFMTARKGSTHGYDITDHSKLNPELGGEDGFAKLCAALKQHDLGLILDFVPNHVGVHFDDNPWWLDVLEWGQASPHAASFDIDWDQLPYRARGGVLLPIIGTSYGHALEHGDIELRYDPDEGSFSCWYFEHRLPIAPERYGEVLRIIVKEAGDESSEAGKAILDLASRYRGLRHPNRKEAPAFKAALKAIPGAADVIAQGIAAYKAGDRGAQTLALHHLLERQHYKLGHWRLASSDINYRRFFDVNTLAGLRVEDAGTFEAIHRLVKKLIADGQLQGLRLDHIDGLRDPAQYFQRLRRLIRDARGPAAGPFYVVIEKILCEHEKLPGFAGVHGTTGYEWMNVITQVLIDGKGLEPLDEIWRQISNKPPKLAPVIKEAKRRVLETLLTSEFTVLTRLLARIANGHYSTRDYSEDILRQALELYVLHFPVYRTYLTTAGPTETDRKLIDHAIAGARAEWFASDGSIFEFLRDALTMDLIKRDRSTNHSVPRVRRFALKVQQFTGPMMAKSLEDTAFYRFHRLLALNEVGGDPAAHALAIADFHKLMRDRARHWPHGMTATATHDTKRGEDARTRLAAITELPNDWTSAMARWKTLNAPHVVTDGKMRAPSAAFEYMLYQTLVGIWPASGTDGTLPERLQAYALKAAREGKEETSWLNPNEAYENGLRAFIDRILDRERSSEFLQSLETLSRRLALLGALNSLTQLTLKATMPGVPDFYQGTEFWDLSMVDPDNRRPVDFAAREHALRACETPDWAHLADHWPDGRIKLAWTRELLKLRNQMPAVFTDGSYEPLEVSGRHADHIIAFARRRGRDAVVVVTVRNFAPFTDGGRVWPHADGFDAEVHARGYTPADMQDGILTVSSIFTHLPAATIPARTDAAAHPSGRRRTAAAPT